jgi:hypothetical protein
MLSKMRGIVANEFYVIGAKVQAGKISGGEGDGGIERILPLFAKQFSGRGIIKAKVWEPGGRVQCGAQREPAGEPRAIH